MSFSSSCAKEKATKLQNVDIVKDDGTERRIAKSNFFQGMGASSDLGSQDPSPKGNGGF